MTAHDKRGSVESAARSTRPPRPASFGIHPPKLSLRRGFPYQTLQRRSSILGLAAVLVQRWHDRRLIAPREFQMTHPRIRCNELSLRIGGRIPGFPLSAKSLTQRFNSPSFRRPFLLISRTCAGKPNASASVRNERRCDILPITRSYGNGSREEVVHSRRVSPDG